MSRQRPSSALITVNVRTQGPMGQSAGVTCALMPSRQGSRALQQRTAIFAAVLALGLADVGIANAQAIYFGFAPRVYDPGLPPHEIMRIVRSTGLAPLTRPGRRGAVLWWSQPIARAARCGVVVDAYSGEIIRINPMLVAGLYAPQVAAPYDPAPRVVTVPPELRDPPPGYGPNARFDDGVPPAAATLECRVRELRRRPPPPGCHPPPPRRRIPPRCRRGTPTPRPRPSVASKETPAAAPAALQATVPASVGA